jgi:hypothetical protein
MERKSESLRISGEVSTERITVTGLVRMENNLITKKKNWQTRKEAGQAEECFSQRN